MTHVSEMYIPGVALSHLVSPLLSIPAAKSNRYALYGHYVVREGDSDAAQSSSVLEAVVRIVLPLHARPPKETELVGFASIKGSSPHKVSFQDVSLLRERAEVAGTSLLGCNRLYPLLLLLATTPLEATAAVGTRKVEYSVFETELSSYQLTERVIPLKVDNMVDSFLSFVRLGTLGSHSFICKQAAPNERKTPSLIERGFESSVSQLQSESDKKQALLKRLSELEHLITQRKGSSVPDTEQHNGSAIEDILSR